jgi:DNA-binding transcriptional LysR family regulator
VLETNAWQVIRDLILMGLGFFVAPRSALEPEIAEGILSGGPIAGLGIARGLIRRTDRPMRRAVQEFLALLEGEAARHGA